MKTFTLFLNNTHSCYCLNKLFDRLDGPAIIGPISQWYYINNQQIDCSSQEEFERIVKLLHFR